MFNLVTQEERIKRQQADLKANEQANIEFNLATARSGDAKAIQALSEKGITVVQDKTPTGSIRSTEFIDNESGNVIQNYQQYESIRSQSETQRALAQQQNIARENQLAELEKRTNTSRETLKFNFDTARSGDQKAIDYLKERGIRTEQTRSPTGSILDTQFFYDEEEQTQQEEKIAEGFDPANLNEGLSPESKSDKQDQEDILALDERKANAGYDSKKKKSGQEVVDQKKIEAEKASKSFDSSGIQNPNFSKGEPSGLSIADLSTGSQDPIPSDTGFPEITNSKTTSAGAFQDTSDFDQDELRTFEQIQNKKNEERVTLVYESLGKEVTLTPDQSRRYREGTFEGMAYVDPQGDIFFAKSQESASKLIDMKSVKPLQEDNIVITLADGTERELSPDQSKRYRSGEFKGEYYIRPNGKIFFSDDPEKANALITSQETQRFPPPTQEQLDRSKGILPDEYSPLGAFSKGATNTLHSYENLGKNIVEFGEGKSEEELSRNTRPPIQDDFFGSLGESAKQKSFKPLEEFGARQSKRDPYMIAGEIAMEGLIWAIPFGAIPKAVKGIGTVAKGAVETGKSIKNINVGTQKPKTPIESTKSYGTSLNDKKPKSDPFTGVPEDPIKETKFPPKETGKPKTETAKQPYNAEPLGTATNLPRKGSKPDLPRGTSIDYDKLFGDDIGEFTKTKVSLGKGTGKVFDADYSGGKGKGSPDKPFTPPEPPTEPSKPSKKQSDESPYDNDKQTSKEQKKKDDEIKKEQDKALDEQGRLLEYGNQFQVAKDPVIEQSMKQELAQETKSEFKGYPVMMGEGKGKIVSTKSKQKKKKKQDESYTTKMLNRYGVSSQTYTTETQVIRYPQTEQGQKLETTLGIMDTQIMDSKQSQKELGIEVIKETGKQKEDQIFIFDPIQNKKQKQDEIIIFDVDQKQGKKQKQDEGLKGIVTVKPFFDQPQKEKPKQVPKYPDPNIPRLDDPDPPYVPPTVPPYVPPPEKPPIEPPIPPTALIPNYGYPDSGRGKRRGSSRRFRVYGIDPNTPLGFSKYGADDYIVRRTKITDKDDPYLKEFKDSKGLKPITGFENNLFTPDNVNKKPRSKPRKTHKKKHRSKRR